MNALLFANNDFSASPQHKDHIRRRYEEQAAPVSLEATLKESDKELIFTLQHFVEMADNLLIVTSEKSTPLVSRILATLGETEMEEKEGRLIPANTDMYDQSSYLLSLGTCRIQVMETESERELPPLLLKESRALLSLNLFGMHPDDARILLDGAAKRHHVTLSSYPHIGGWSVLDVAAKSESAVSGFLEETALLFQGKVCAGSSIARHLVERLSEMGKTFTCAESCTGGRIASLITAVSGSSAVFDGSMVTYANRVKHDWIGVNETSLIAYGAVSSAVVEEMAAGILDYSGADYAVAVSGIAGPGGGTAEKPVGTVYIAAACRKKGVRSERLSLHGDRAHIQISASFQALRLLFETFPELI